MNILFLSDIPFIPSLGGIERVTDILSKNLSSRGYNVFYLSGHNSSITKEYEYPAKAFYFPNEGLLDDEENLRYYRQILVEKQIKVVVNQRGLQATFNKAYGVAGVRVVSVFHSQPKAYLYMSIYRILAHDKNLLGNIKAIVKYLIYPFLRSYIVYKKKIELSKRYNYTMMQSSAVVLLSEKYIDELMSFNINLKHCPIVVIPNPNTYNYVKAISKDKVVLYVGRLSHYDKKPMRLLESWQLLHEEFNDWKLVFVGDGDSLDEMRMYVKDHKLSNVCFEGQSESVEKYYEKAAIICLTSNFEGWGMSLTEGMSYGCIPVTYNNFGAASDIIDDGLNGYLIKPFDSKRYAKRLKELMSNPELRYSMSREATIKVQKFSPEAIVDKWEALFRKILEG